MSEARSRLSTAFCVLAAAAIRCTSGRPIRRLLSSRRGVSDLGSASVCLASGGDSSSSSVLPSTARSSHSSRAVTNDSIDGGGFDLQSTRQLTLSSDLGRSDAPPLSARISPLSNRRWRTYNQSQPSDARDLSHPLTLYDDSCTTRPVLALERTTAVRAQSDSLQRRGGVDRLNTRLQLSESESRGGNAMLSHEMGAGKARLLFGSRCGLLAVLPNAGCAAQCKLGLGDSSGNGLLLAML